QNTGVQNVGNQNRLIVVSGTANQNLNGNGNLVAARAEGNVPCNNANLDEIVEVNANCIFMANLQQALTSGTQTDKAPVYDSDGSAEVHNSDNCYDNEIFNMFTQEEQYTKLLEPIPEPHQVQQNDNNVIFEVSSVEQSGRTIEQHPENVEETLVLFDSLYNNLAIEVEKVNTEADKSLDKQKSLELKIKRLLKASVSYDIMFIMQNGFVDVPSNLQTELNRMKEKLELCIIKKEKEYVVLWNNWYTKCEECKYDKISYDKAYNDMQQKVKRLQAQLRDLKGKSSDTPSASNTLDPLSEVESKIVELEFQVVNYEREISHLKTTYKNLFDSITSNRAHAKLHNLIYENAKLRARLFENTFEPMNNTSGTSVTPQADKPKLIAVSPYSKKVHASIPSHSVPQPREFNVVNHRNVIAPGMFKIDSSQTSRVDMENVSSDTVNASSTGLVHTARTRRPPPKGNSKNVRVPSASKSSEVKKMYK
nr:hypothetical protein [Tanacetum cinerariifolium]